MPYDSNDNLPNAVKDALPGEAQTIFRKAFNSAFDGDDAAASKIAWTAVKKSGFKKDEAGNWHKANSQLDLFASTHQFDAEIFSAGKWNGDKYSENDLQDIADNFNALADSVKPPVKLGHAWKEGQPALGWVSALKKVGNKLVATLSDVPQIVYDAIKAGRYKRVSSEIYWNYKSKAGKTFNYVLKAVALLGADIPAVSDLKDLTAYLSEIHKPDGSFDRVASYELEVGDDFKLKQETKKQREVKTMSDEDRKTYQEKIDAERKAKEAAEQDAKNAKAELKKFQDQQVKDRQEQREKAFKDECDRLVKDGRLTPAERDKLVGGIATFKYDDEGFYVPFINLKEIAEGRQVLDTKEYGEDGKPIKKQKQYTDASDELADRAREYQRKEKVTYSEAVDAVLAADADLAERYKIEDV